MTIQELSVLLNWASKADSVEQLTTRIQRNSFVMRTYTRRQANKYARMLINSKRSC